MKLNIKPSLIGMHALFAIRVFVFEASLWLCVCVCYRDPWLSVRGGVWCSCAFGSAEGFDGESGYGP